MGGRGGSSGISAKGSNFEKISLDGKTGTEKQRAYAENLLELARLTAKMNGIAGYSPIEGSSMRTYTSQEDADSIKATYKFLKEAINQRKTYGQVIDFMKSNDLMSLQKTLKGEAAKNKQTVPQFVDEFLKKAKKKK